MLEVASVCLDLRAGNIKIWTPFTKFGLLYLIYSENENILRSRWVLENKNLGKGKENCCIIFPEVIARTHIDV